MVSPAYFLGETPTALVKALKKLLLPLQSSMFPISAGEWNIFPMKWRYMML